MTALALLGVLLGILLLWAAGWAIWERGYCAGKAARPEWVDYEDVWWI